MNDDTEIVYYVYGFARTNLRVDLTGGIVAEQPPRLWPCLGGISAIVSNVKRSDFCGPQGDANLGNLAWLAPRVVMHQAVLEQAMKQGPVFPARFGTLFSSLESLENLLASCAPTISAFLASIEGQEEWSVQGFMDPSVSEPAWLARNRSEATSDKVLSPGAAYMLEERLLADMKVKIGDWMMEQSSDLLEQLTPLADEACERRLLPNEDPASKRAMVSNWAFLIPAQNLAGFRSHVERMSGQCESMGLTFALAGLWPPYSFCPNLTTDNCMNAVTNDLEDT